MFIFDVEHPFYKVVSILLLLMGTSRYIFDLVSWQLQSANVYNNNNKIWLFITHSTERNLRFFMHNCAYILKKLSEQLNLKRIS